MGGKTEKSCRRLSLMLKELLKWPAVSWNFLSLSDKPDTNG
jgi:hypothetical protein